MANMTIADAAEHFGISKEAIHNRIRRGSLAVSIVDGVKLVDVEANAKPSTQTKPKTTRRTTTATTQVSDDRYYKLLEEQNTQLQTKLEKFEKEISSLRDQKEQMLIDERIKIEQIYKDKDEQLKTILHTLSSELMLTQPSAKKEEHLEAEIEEEIVVKELELKTKLIPLKKYFKSLKLSQKREEKLKTRFKKRAGKDKRIIVSDSKIYVDTIKYKYKDLLK